MPVTASSWDSPWFEFCNEHGPAGGDVAVNGDSGSADLQGTFKPAYLRALADYLDKHHGNRTACTCGKDEDGKDEGGGYEELCAYDAYLENPSPLTCGCCDYCRHECYLRA